MHRAIAAARRAFDETDWSTNHAFRQALPPAAARTRSTSEQGEAAAADRGRGRRAVMLTYAVQQDACIDDMQWDIDLIDRYEWERDAAGPRVHGHAQQPQGRARAVGVVGAITPWNFPLMLNLAKLGPRSRPATPSCSSPRPTRRGTRRARPAHRRADRHPAGRGQRRHLVATTARRRDAHRATRGST